MSIALSLVLTALDNTIVSASVNKIIDDIGGLDKVSWIYTAYALAATSTMLIFGKLSDQFGRKALYLFAIGLFLLGSSLCGTAVTIEQLSIYRVTQGIGAGGIFPIYGNVGQNGSYPVQPESEFGPGVSSAGYRNRVTAQGSI